MATRLSRIGLLFAALFATLPVSAQLVSVSSDVTVTLGTNEFDDDEGIGVDTSSSLVVPHFAFDLPDRTELVAYDIDPATGDKLFALDTITELSTGLTAELGDVIRFDGSMASVEFDSSFEGVAEGARVDALAVGAASSLVLSFDTTVDLGGGLVVEDEDLVQWTASSGFALFVDGSAQSIPRSLDVDGVDWEIATNRLLVSFDTSGSVGGVVFDDDDVLTLDLGTGTWSKLYDGSANDPQWAAADVTSVPEPASGAALWIGVVALGALARRRAHPDSRLR